MILQAQNRALATNLYAYRRRIADLDTKGRDLARKNEAMYAVLSGLHEGMEKVRTSNVVFPLTFLVVVVVVVVVERTPNERK